MVWIRLRAKGRPPSQRFSHAATSLADSMYVFGGRTKFEVFDDLYRYDVVSNQWSQVRTHGLVPVGPVGMGLIAVDRELVLVGGDGLSTTAWHLSRGQISDTYSGTNAPGHDVHLEEGANAQKPRLAATEGCNEWRAINIHPAVVNGSRGQ